MVSANTILVQGVLFIQTLLYGLMGAFAIGAFIIMVKFRFIVEINKQTGSGVLVQKHRAVRIKDKAGNFHLYTLRRKKFSYPKDDSFIYKQGRNFLIRFYQLQEGDYHPMKLDIDKKNYKFDVIPQNIKYLYKSNREEVEEKYKKKRELLDRYGQMIGFGVLIFGFVVAMYFMMHQVESAIALGNSVVSQAAQCKQLIL